MADEMIRALLAGNIRIDDSGDDSELRDSLQRFGWSPKFPALKDEHGAVLVGHRRLRLAKELGVAPVVDIVQFGEGDAADAERVKLALISNIGGKPMTAKDRQHIAEHLYGERQWTMQRIAEALNVSAMQVSRDLADFNPELKSPRAKSASNPKGAGRPKGTRGKPKFTEARKIVRARMERGEPVSPHKLAKEHGLSHFLISDAIETERAIDEVRADPVVDPATLPKSAQAKLAASTRQMKRRLQDDFQRAVAERMQAALGDVILSRYDELKSLYNGVINRRKHGVMKPAEYRLILSCLHPDSRLATSDARLAEAMAVIQKYKLSLVDESVEPTPLLEFPRTRAEWEARRREVKAARRAKRTGSAVAKT